MKKSLRMKLMLLLCAMIVGISNVWATDEEFDFTSMSAIAAGAQEFEQGQITVSCTNGAVATQSSTMQLRWYSGETLTVSASSGYVITDISITKGASDKGTISLADGSGGTLSGDTGAGSGNVATWTGEESSVEFSTSGQSRVTNITVSYQSSSIPTHAITYSVNSATNTVNVSEGSAVDLSAPAKSLIPVGYVFRGWRSATLAEVTDTEPSDYVTSATSTADATYYAVFAKITVYVPDTYVKLTDNSFDSDAIYVIGAVQGGTGGDGTTIMYFNSYDNTVNSNISWGICTSSPTTESPIKFTLSGKASALVAQDSNGNYLRGLSTGKFCMSSNSENIYLNSDGAIKASSSGYKLRYNHNSGKGGLRWYDGATGAQAYFYEVIDNCTYGRFCTTVSSVSIAENVTISGNLNINNYVLTVPNGKTLTVNGTLTNATAANLVIEDGGQLICSNSVTATVKKNISAATAKDVTNWYGISSSVHKSGETYEEMSSVTNLLGGTYDMFYYNEAESKWMNQKATVSPYSAAYTNMESCKGYIYRNADAVVLSYEGVTNAGEISQYTLSHTSSLTNGLKGVNHIGNPYPHKIYKSVAFATTSGTATDTLQTGYYVIGGDGSCTATADNVAIDVNQAVLVIATEYANGKTLKFKDRTKAPAGGGSKANNDNIKFMVSNSQYEDVAYALFDKGSGLDKINHRNADIPMIYIPQDDNNYAIAMMSDDTKSFNLNFKAMTMGQYTLQAKTDGNYSYLHIFDRMTGEDIDMLLEGEYSFIASPSDNDSRFIVNLAYNPGSNTVENEVFAYQSGSDIIVNGEGELQVFDITGRRVMTTTINGVESINIPNQGVYIFKLNEKVQKIVVR